MRFPPQLPLPRLALCCRDTADGPYSIIPSVSKVAYLLQSKHWRKAGPVTFEATLRTLPESNAVRVILNLLVLRVSCKAVESLGMLMSAIAMSVSISVLNPRICSGIFCVGFGVTREMGHICLCMESLDSVL